MPIYCNRRHHIKQSTVSNGLQTFKGGGVNTAKRMQWRGILFIIGDMGGDISYILCIQSSQMEGINSTK